MVPMRDGVRLATEIYRPRDAQGPVPAVFWRTPYNFSPLPGPNLERPSALLKFGLDAIERGYAFVVQNERGKFFSEGDWEILGRPRDRRLRRADLDHRPVVVERQGRDARLLVDGGSGRWAWQRCGIPATRPPYRWARARASAAWGRSTSRGTSTGAAPSSFRWRSGSTASRTPYGRPSRPAPAREDLARLATYFDLAAKMPAVDWQQTLRHLPVQTLMESVGGPKGIFGEFGRPHAGRSGLVRGRPLPRRRALRRAGPVGELLVRPLRVAQPGPLRPRAPETPTRRSAITSTWS